MLSLVDLPTRDMISLETFHCLFKFYILYIMLLMSIYGVNWSILTLLLFLHKLLHQLFREMFRENFGLSAVSSVFNKLFFFKCFINNCLV